MLEQKILTNAQQEALAYSASLWSHPTYPWKKHPLYFSQSDKFLARLHHRHPPRSQWKNACMFGENRGGVNAAECDARLIDRSVLRAVWRNGVAATLSACLSSDPQITLLWLRTRLTAVGREKAAASSDTAVGHSLGGPARASWRDTRPTDHQPDGPSALLVTDCRSRLAQFAAPTHSLPLVAPRSANFCNLRTLLSLATSVSIHRQRSTMQCATHTAFAEVNFCAKNK